MTIPSPKLTIEVGTFDVPFKTVFKHTSAARAATENVVVRLTDPDSVVGYGEGCPRQYVTGETKTTAIEFVESYAGEVVEGSPDVEGLRTQITKHRSVIDKNPAAFCAIELAVLDLLARKNNQTIEELLSHQRLPASFTYSAVIGDSGPLTFSAQLLRYRAFGLRDYKLKISGDVNRDKTKLRWFKGHFGRLVANTVRIDANNLWTESDEAIRYLKALEFEFLGVEEPMIADDLESSLAVAEALDTRIILDESLLRAEQLEQLPGDPDRWILNCRVSKSGGLLRSLDLIEASVKGGLGVIVGAHVGETSLLTRAALTAAHAAGGSLIAQEGAFGTTLLTNDICDAPLMFGRGGQLSSSSHPSTSQPGLGIDVLSDRLVGMSKLVTDSQR